ncbi:CDP-glycerol glycerophosphotransferase family protein [Francisella philomiragia]|uniref:CDP-glycerol glycerophosphotransferase family protein n=1 Tax=Francisella philomiragia TaxID=28110 RepID=UPI0019085FBB|nr:CDP-glycerol glycerophosphotransferase family protein [Francisella philomiragia]MBK2255831.1 CDP-glycerol glycerophosphotransferase family protein [Francisella philomiragia]MBK2268489.1 CDP-glycerol glycerophosphotransferase family protein [Francisella philomiragia]MBK2271036.1 CDP-glycerol glycerophosphotransferase family protein [Francisella philomiragia]MBK2274816.1 CDP-glycerol glycerophosphotransferase family protein [Francisella philomiragia]MBK2294410.1 CDP-glycerol glycerophosphotra
MFKIKILTFFAIHKIILLLSYLFPRNKNIWVFGSFNGCFNDNSKYLFLDIYENHQEITPVWISENKKLVSDLRKKKIKAYYKWSLVGIYFCLRGKVYFYNAYITDINNYFYAGAIRFNLWHGTPMKKIEFDIKKGKLATVFNNSLRAKIINDKHYIKPSYILSMSKMVSSWLSSAFKLDICKCLEFGYPRNDLLLYPLHQVCKFIDTYEDKYIKNFINTLKEYKRVYIYMPTWRDDNSDFIQDSDINFEVLNTFLKEESAVLILKLHTNTKLNLKINYENLLILKSSVDVYPILPFTDILITDYSSIIFDYKLMNNKKVILFPFDINSYISKYREMYFDYDKFSRSEITVYNFNDLLNVVKNIDKFVNEENTLLNEIIQAHDLRQSNYKIIKFVKSKLGI